MIHEVDDALRGLVTEEPLAGTGVEVSFDAPTKEWAARRNAPTVSLFLYDIREDVARRRQGSVAEYDERGATVALHDPPRFFALSYLVTAWTNHTQDEHRLLSVLLAGLLRHDALPAARLTGSLATLNLTVPMTVAGPPGDNRALADVWSALGGELKPSLDLVVVAPLSARRVAAAPPVVDGLRLRTTDPAETSALRYTDPAPAPAGPAETEPDAPVTTVGVRRTRGAGRDRDASGTPIRGHRR
ncbi:DUF4255 domain-containing protein [Planosporangium sp. 12N6]|uniref:DUF4255 domain-containing protein n=1 Tax=Planosporangium spinosum TaxID=3402278 RepID=UPI003CFB8CA4